MSENQRTVTRTEMEAEWVEIQAAQRDAARFRPLYERYYEQIFRFVHRRVDREALAAEICSDIFLKAMQKIGSYTFRGVPFSAWLYRIASNEVTQHFRRNAKNRTISTDDVSLGHLAEETAPEENPQRREKLLQCLDGLREKDLQLVEMRFFEQRPFKEIADILDITESNAKVRTYRVLDRLKKRMIAL